MAAGGHIEVGQEEGIPKIISESDSWWLKCPKNAFVRPLAYLPEKLYFKISVVMDLAAQKIRPAYLQGTWVLNLLLIPQGYKINHKRL